MEIRQHLNVQGTVQGVGFRYRAKHMADALALTGTVKNLPDVQSIPSFPMMTGLLEILLWMQEFHRKFRI